MSTFVGEGNIGSAPEFQEFPSGNDEPRRLLRLIRHAFALQPRVMPGPVRQLVKCGGVVPPSW